MDGMALPTTTSATYSNTRVPMPTPTKDQFGQAVEALMKFFEFSSIWPRRNKKNVTNQTKWNGQNENEGPTKEAQFYTIIIQLGQSIRSREGLDIPTGCVVAKNGGEGRIG